MINVIYLMKTLDIRLNKLKNKNDLRYYGMNGKKMMMPYVKIDWMLCSQFDLSLSLCNHGRRRKQS